MIPHDKCIPLAINSPIMSSSLYNESKMLIGVMSFCGKSWRRRLNIRQNNTKQKNKAVEKNASFSCVPF
jgi:hypothetical protein